jgi:hypothetical protein
VDVCACCWGCGRACTSSRSWSCVHVTEAVVVAVAERAQGPACMRPRSCVAVCTWPTVYVATIVHGRVCMWLRLSVHVAEVVRGRVCT